MKILHLYTHLFYKQRQAKISKKKKRKEKGKAKQYPEAELLLFENYSLSLSMLSSKNDTRHS